MATMMLLNQDTLPNLRDKEADEHELETIQNKAVPEINEPDEAYEREAELIVFENCNKGLGIKITGGCSLNNEEDYGIFVKRILPAGLAELDGRLCSGDQILQVNGESLEGVTNDRAVSILRKASASSNVEMIVARDEQAKAEFVELLQHHNGFSLPCTPIPTELQSKASSRSATPSIHGSLDRRSWSHPEERSSLSYKSSADSCSPRSITSQSEQDQSLTQVSDLEKSPHEQLSPSITSTSDNPLSPAMSSTPYLSNGANTDSKPIAQQPVHRILTESMFSQEPSPIFQSSHSPYHTLPETSSMNRSELSRSSSLPKTRFSLDPHVRLKVQNLEVALGYLGIEPTSEQKNVMRKQLCVDSMGTVTYGDFVAVAKDLFHLEDRAPSSNISVNTDWMDIVEPPAFKSQELNKSNNEDYNALKMDRDHLRHQVQLLQETIDEKEYSCNEAEDELLKIRREAQGAIHESRSLRSKVHMAEQAQQVARTMEQDYEEVVRLLEGEITQLKLQKGVQGENVSAQKKIAILTCQLRKTEAAKRMYEVATEKLLSFAENVHEVLSGQGNGVIVKPLSNQRENMKNSGVPSYLNQHKTKTAKTLATDARDIVRAVRSLIEAEPLPYGWEEAHTADGMRYYTNHLMQTTAWAHPVSGVQQLSPVVQHTSSKETDRKHDIQETKT